MYNLVYFNYNSIHLKKKKRGLSLWPQVLKKKNKTKNLI